MVCVWQSAKRSRSLVVVLGVGWGMAECKEVAQLHCCCVCVAECKEVAQFLYPGGLAEGRPAGAGELPQPRAATQQGTSAQHAHQAGRPGAGLSHQLGQTCARSVLAPSVMLVPALLSFV